MDAGMERVKVFLGIINNSCAESSVYGCKACCVYKNLVKSLTDWN